MNNIRKLTDSLFWVGVNDRRIALFENVYPVPTGMSYNSYVLLDEKTALFDTVDASFTHDFLENVTAALKGRTLDYLIVNHMEPDHCASIADVIAAYPEAKIVCTAKAVGMMKQFFDFDVDSRAILVKEGDTISFVMNEHVDYNGKTYPIASLPENLMSIIRAGGLVKAMRKLNGLD